MSDLVLPRYTTGSVTGVRYMYKSNHVSVTGGSKPIITTWYVYDRLRNYRVVAFFNARHFGNYTTGFDLTARLQATAKARKLERRYRKWLRQQGLL